MVAASREEMSPLAALLRAARGSDAADWMLTEVGDMLIRLKIWKSAGNRRNAGRESGFGWS